LKLNSSTNSKSQKEKIKLGLTEFIQQMGRGTQGEPLLFEIDGTHNNFLGSLKALENCQKLRKYYWRSKRFTYFS
jgi:hypothetical protein